MANVSSSSIRVTLMMEALSSNETSVLTGATWSNIPEDVILYLQVPAKSPVIKICQFHIHSLVIHPSPSGFFNLSLPRMSLGKTAYLRSRFFPFQLLPTRWVHALTSEALPRDLCGMCSSHSQILIPDILLALTSPADPLIAECCAQRVAGGLLAVTSSALNLLGLVALNFLRRIHVLCNYITTNSIISWVYSVDNLPVNSSKLLAETIGYPTCYG
jgi:hypothetical protein